MNNENNINGIPNVNDIKIEDTPAESFASIYGNGGQPQQPTPVQQPVPPVQPTPAPQPVPPVQPTVAPQPVPPVQPTPAPQPVPPVQPTPAPQPVPPVQPTPAPQPVPPVQPTPAPQPVPPVQPTPVPQPVPPVQQTVETIQPVQVDADRLQSIEEQLSKTSQYKPEDFQQEKIEIPTAPEYEKNNSVLAFLITLSIILGLVVFALPFITKYFN